MKGGGRRADRIAPDFAACDRRFAASSLSAALPCRSDFDPSFLKAYATAMLRLEKNWPFIASIAASDASNESKLTNPNPREVPDSDSIMTFADKTAPKREKVWNNIRSSTS